MTAPTNDAPVTVEPDWLNADVCIENMQIAYDDATEDEDDTPVDTVVSAGDLGVLIGLAQYAVRHRLAALASAPAGDGEPFTGVEAWDELVNVDDRTSPEEYPDMCLITRDELIDFMRRASAPAGDGVDWEADAWRWLDNRGAGLDPAADPNDRDYGTDDMVDAFIAGTEAALARPRAAVGEREA